MTTKILLVDDEPQVLEALALVLRKHDVEIESDPRLALRLVKDCDYAVVVSDLRMPHMDGIEFLRAVSYISPRSVRIMLTGHGDMDVAISAINTSGVFKFLTKPVDAVEMRETISSAIAAHRRMVEEAEIRDSAFHDELTGAPNRTLFLDRFKVALARAQRNKTTLAVLFIDLDGFKAVNDSYGHDAGDRVLVEIYSRFADRVRENDSVARFGGDEFVVLLSDLDDSLDAEKVARELVELAMEPIDWQENALNVGASIGIGFYPEHGNSIEAVMVKADAAMYEAKKEGGGRFKVALRD